jgi:hypothetical protein
VGAVEDEGGNAAGLDGRVGAREEQERAGCARS